MLLNIKKRRKGTELADMGLIIAFIGVVAITVFQIAGNELKDFFNNMNSLQEKVRQESIDSSGST